MRCERDHAITAPTPASSPSRRALGQNPRAEAFRASPDLQRSLFLLGERLARLGDLMDEHLRPLRQLCESLSEYGRVSAVYEPLAAAMCELVKVWAASLPPPESLAADLYRVFAHTRTDQERVAAAKRLLKHFGLKPDPHKLGSLFLAAAEIGDCAPWQENEALAFVQCRMWNEIRRRRAREKREFPLEDRPETTLGRRGLSALEAEMTLAAIVKEAAVPARAAELLLARYHGEAGTDAGARLGLKPSAARVSLHRTRTKIKKIA